MFDITGAFTPTHAGRQLLWMGYSALVHRDRKTLRPVAKKLRITKFGAGSRRLHISQAEIILEPRVMVLLLR